MFGCTVLHCCFLMAFCCIFTDFPLQCTSCNTPFLSKSTPNLFLTDQKQPKPEGDFMSKKMPEMVLL